jgi:flavin-binding protein dodecin
MSVAKVIELSATSNKSFEDAILQGLARASQTLKGISGAWVKEQSLKVENGRPSEWQVILKVTFVLE